MPLLSIITVVRDDLAGLERTRSSVAAQLFQDLEWLIIDGASTDGTAQFARGILEPPVSVVSEPDRGIYDAMNKGLDLAAGDYVLFLNAGDTLVSPATLDRVARRLRHGVVDFLYGDSFEDRSASSRAYKSARSVAGVGYGMFGCHQAMYYRRSLIESQRYDPVLRIAGDYRFTAEFLRKQPRIVKMEEALCVFELSGASMLDRRRGRRENWLIQRDVLGLSLPRRCLVQAAYLCSAALKKSLPFVYGKLRFRRQHGQGASFS